MPSPVQFVITHMDNCPRCSVCDFCPTGKALMKAASDLCAEMIAGPPEEKKAWSLAAGMGHSKVKHEA
jgi:hypothetical protein